MTSSGKPEAHNVPQRRQRRTESLPGAKVGEDCIVLEICSRTDTDTLISRDTPIPVGRSNEIFNGALMLQPRAQATPVTRQPDRETFRIPPLVSKRTIRIADEGQRRIATTAQALLWNVTSAGWQVTLCDPIWHACSRSGEGSC